MKDKEPWSATVHGSQRVRHDLATKQKQFCISKGGISISGGNMHSSIVWAKLASHLKGKIY